MIDNLVEIVCDGKPWTVGSDNVVSLFDLGPVVVIALKDQSMSVMDWGRIETYKTKDS